MVVADQNGPQALERSELSGRAEVGWRAGWQVGWRLVGRSWRSLLCGASSQGGGLRSGRRLEGGVCRSSVEVEALANHWVWFGGRPSGA